jgi:hypothetical protein
MNDLRNKQKAFLDLITSSKPIKQNDLSFLKSSKASVESVLDIYRRNHVEGCKRSLQIKYPAIEKIVGKKYFSTFCESYIAENIPQNTNLNNYGNDFYLFINKSDISQKLKYLCDIALAEYFLSLSRKSDNSSNFDNHKFASLSESEYERTILVINDSVFLMQSLYPVKDILDFNNAEYRQTELTINEQKRYFMIFRDVDLKAKIQQIREYDYFFIEKSKNNKTLFDIYEEMESDNSDELFHDIIIRFIENGIFKDFKLS